MNYSSRDQAISPQYNAYKGLSHTAAPRASSAPRQYPVASSRSTNAISSTTMRHEPAKEQSVERLKSCIQDLKKLATNKVKKSSSHVGTSVTNTMNSQQNTRGSERVPYDAKYRENLNPNLAKQSYPSSTQARRQSAKYDNPKEEKNKYKIANALRKYIHDIEATTSQMSYKSRDRKQDSAKKSYRSQTQRPSVSKVPSTYKPSRESARERSSPKVPASKDRVSSYK